MTAAAKMLLKIIQPFLPIIHLKKVLYLLRHTTAVIATVIIEKIMLDLSGKLNYNYQADKFIALHSEKSRSPAERARLEIVYTP